MRYLTILTTACLLAHVLIALPASAECHVIEGVEINTTLTPEDFEGTGSVTIDGRNFPLKIIGINLGFTETEDDGTQHAVTSSEWRIGTKGMKLITFEDARLDPTETPGVFLYVGRSRVTTGRGRFNCGEMVIQGEADFNTGLGTFPVLRGRLCHCD